MALSATLRCPCEPSDTGGGFSYEAPPAGETSFDLGESRYRRRYRVCMACSHWFGDHDLDLTSLYRRDYVNATYGGEGGLAARFRKVMALSPERSDNRQRVARVVGYAAQTGLRPTSKPRLLDVGAGLGVFPAGMAEQGWDVVGLEPDPRTVDHLRKVVGIRALCERLEALEPISVGLFEVVTFNKVLEHVEDPVGMLAAAIPLMAGRSFVYIEVPDVAAAAGGPSREEFFIEHHHVFSPASLVAMVERAGLAVGRLERLREPSGKFTLAVFAVVK